MRGFLEETLQCHRNGITVAGSRNVGKTMPQVGSGEDPGSGPGRETSSSKEDSEQDPCCVSLCIAFHQPEITKNPGLLQVNEKKR